MGETLQAGMGDERRAHYESRCFLTLSWLPPVDDVQDFGNLLLDRPKDIHRQDWRNRLEYFINETARAADLLEAIMPEFEALDDAGTLTYLHGIISTRHHPEIGRASCRERVCQDVKITVVAGTLKKK